MTSIRGASTGRGRLVLVSGEPGIGKSRLLEVLRSRASRAGARVLTGRCWEAGGAPAYWPWVDALRPLVAECDPRRVRRGRRRQRRARDDPPRDRRRAPARSPSRRSFRRRRRASGSSTRRPVSCVVRRVTTPLVVTLDDLHAADVPSVLLLTFAARALADARVVLVGAYREAELAQHRELAPIAADRAAVRIALRGLSEQEVAQLVRRARGRSSGRRGRRVARTRRRRATRSSSRRSRVSAAARFPTACAT